MQKIDAMITFPTQLTLNSNVYELYALINHFGNFFGGHYTSMIKYNDSWNHINDEKIDVIKNLPYEGFNNTIDVFDDFAHHPTEIKYSITSLKEKYKGKKLLSICEIKSNSMLRGTHKEELYNALKISDLSLVISTKNINNE